MNSWSEKITQIINDKLKGSREKDLRFFRVEELKRNINRIESFSPGCPECQKQKIFVEEIANQIDTAINVPGKTRREYDRLIGHLSRHMRKEHGFYPPYHFTYFFSFFGMSAGVIAGYVLMKAIPGYSEAMFSLGFVSGLITGYFMGSVRDRRIRKEKRLM